MKKLLIFLTCMLLFSSCTSKTEANEESPIAYFSFDKLDKNDNFYDLISGNACYKKGNPLIVSGYNDNALYVQEDSYLSFDTILPSGNSNHTIACWIKFDKNNLSNNGEYVIAGWGEYQNLSDTRLMIYHKQFCVTSFNVCTFYPLNENFNNEWCHFALSYDGEKYTMYLNSIPVREVIAPQGINLKKSPLYIGGFNDMLNFSGYIDDLYVFDRSLDELEINKCMKGEIKMTLKEANNIMPSSSSLEEINFNNYDKKGWNKYLYFDDKSKLTFAIHLPNNFSKDKKYPLIFFLHGDGSNGQSVESVYLGDEFAMCKRAMIENGECIVVVPSASKSWLRVPNDNNVKYPYRNYNMNEAEPSNELLLANKLLDDCISKLNIDTDRVYLCGYSRGTMGCWYLLTNFSNKFAASIVCSGAGDPNVTKNFSSVPLWVFMGDKDELVSYEDVKEIFDSYQNNGGDGRFTRCVNLGHGVSDYLYQEKDLITWLFSKKRGA